MKYDYEDALHLLSDEKWTSLNVEQKLAVLQSVEYKEASRVGRLPCNIVGEVIDDSDGGITLGYFDTETKDIKINTSQLEADSKYGNNYREHLDTVLHEGRHAYQDQCINGLNINESPDITKRWEKDYNNYISPEEGHTSEYKDQFIERDASIYAEYKSLGVEKDKLNMEKNELLQMKRDMLEKDLSSAANQKINLLEQKKTLLQQYLGDEDSSDGKRTDMANKRSEIYAQMNDNSYENSFDSSHSMSYGSEHNSGQEQEHGYSRRLSR